MGARGRERGLNIAWTYLQLDWMNEGHEGKYGPLTHPEKIHAYIRKWPGLMDCCHMNPEILALYAPQITIPGFDDGFADLFDRLLEVPYRNSLNFFSYSGPSTVDGKDPLCGEVIAWRHPRFGNFTETELASSFARAHTGHYTRQPYDGFTCLIWLLTDAANWMPDSHRSRLINGLRRKTYWWATDTHLLGSDNKFFDALWTKSRSKFRFSRTVRTDLEELIKNSLLDLGINESPATIAQRFIDAEFVEGYFDEQKRIRKARASNL